MGTHLLYEKKCGDPWTGEITEQEEVEKQPAPRKPQFLQVQSKTNIQLKVTIYFLAQQLEEEE